MQISTRRRIAAYGFSRKVGSERRLLITTFLDQREQRIAAANTVLPALLQVLFKIPRGGALEDGALSVRWRLELQPFRDATPGKPRSPSDLAARQPLLPKYLNGLENLFSGFAMGKT